ncbi:MAG TPA: sigma 54-interacting transcriptional regulator [Bacillota bacterium]|nr:sigma 54-interacting transcriptional regulator [Bacillota bacterium]
MIKEEVPFGIRVAQIAKTVSEKLAEEIDMMKIREDRRYISELQSGRLKTLLFESARTESLIAQIYFQFTPEVTPQLGPDEFGAGVCIENIGDWNICEHNMSYIRDFVPENRFLKWWYFESIRIREGGFTRPYFDPYMRIDVITYSVPVHSSRPESKEVLMGVLGIDVAYNDFKEEMNRKLVEHIRSDVESVRKDFELVGDKGALANQLIDVNTFEIISREKILDGLVTSSGDMERVMDLAMKASMSDANVLLQGETGVGKDFWANFIHSRSKSCGGRLINVNCCALPESLAESEFFGYGKGAFTGAQGAGKAGFFEAANGGTILLNEIGDLPLHIQAKLLSVIQDKAVIRVGETLPRVIDFRLIAASNKDLLQCVKEGKFREDLYYRLNVISIHIPPLRERKDDIFSLLNYFLAKNVEKYKTGKRLSIELLTKLLNYSWPGNIRELENLVERLFITSNGPVLREEDLPEEYMARMSESGPDRGEKVFPAGAETVFPSGGEKRPAPTLKELMEAAEGEIILERYQRLGSSYKVAKDLGISQSQASQKIRKYLGGPSKQLPNREPGQGRSDEFE